MTSQLAEARRLIRRAIDKAEQVGVRGAIAVVGGSGVLVSASRMDRGGAGGMARARSKAWIAATQQVPSTVHHVRVTTLPAPIGAGFVACSPEARFPGAGGMPIADESGAVVAGFSASGATVGPFVDFPGVDRRYLIAQGKPANSEDLLVLWALGLPYEGQHGDDAKRWLDAFGELPDEEGLGYSDPPPAHQPEHEWALALSDRAMAAAAARGVRIAVARRRPPRRPDPAGHDGRRRDGGAVRRRGGRRGRRDVPAAERGGRPSWPPLLPYRVATVPGGLPVAEGERVVRRPRHRAALPTRRSATQIAARGAGVRVCVVGCGAIGGLFAAHLARRDVEVWAYDVSAEHVAAINRDGLRVDGRRRLPRPRRAPTRGEIPPCELGIVATKATFTEAAMARHRARVRRRRRLQRAERHRQRGGRSPATCRA